MTELGSLRSVQCPIEDIPEGQLKDYMLASSACFPALRPREIDGVKYIDGGWRDNMPLDPGCKDGRSGAARRRCGRHRHCKPNTTGLPTRIVRSHWNLGPTLDFDPPAPGATSRWATLTRCGCLAAAAARPTPCCPTMRNFWLALPSNTKSCWPRSAPAHRKLTLWRKTRGCAQTTRRPTHRTRVPTRGALALLELAAERVGVPEDVPYTPKLLAATFMGSFDKDPADRFPALLDGRDNTPRDRACHRRRRARGVCDRPGQQDPGRAADFVKGFPFGPARVCQSIAL